jgi:hypothetical protein
MKEINNKDDDWRAFKCESSIKFGIPHCFHIECIEGWIKEHETCPTCPICRGLEYFEN